MENDDTLVELERLMQHEFFLSPTCIAIAYIPAIRPDSSTKVYRYRLLPENTTIRLLRLEPGQRSDDLRGSLVHTLLYRNEGYEALSYAWGSGETPCKLLLDGASLRITKSLEDALLQLRKPDRVRMLWVDAVCINQSSNEEKSHQITLMGQIYENASRVICWLGNTDEQGIDERAMALLQTIGNVNFGTLDNRVIREEWAVANGLPPICHADWSCLVYFWQKLYFRRSWIIQEIVKAKSITFMCGDHKIEWQVFANGVEKMIEYTLCDWGTYLDPSIEEERVRATGGALAFQAILNIKHSMNLEDSIGYALKSFSERDASCLQELEEGRWSRVPGLKEAVMSLRQHPDTAKAMVPVHADAITLIMQSMGLDVSIEPTRFPLIVLFTLFRSCEATLPADRLYAFLGIAKDADHPDLKPDYNEPLFDTMARYARTFLQLDPRTGIMMLYNAGLAHRLPIMEGAPSWIPDWISSNSTPHHILSFGASTSFGYHAAGSTMPSIKFPTNDKHSVILSGSFMDTIATILTQPRNPNASTPDDEYFRTFPDFLARVDALIQDDPTPYPTLSPSPGHSALQSDQSKAESRYDIQWRTLTGNIGVRPHILPASTRATYTAARDLISSFALSSATEVMNSLFSGGMNSANEWFSWWLAKAMYYDVVQTERGFVGIAPIGTRVGDAIVIVKGANMPFVVRDDGEGGGGRGCRDGRVGRKGEEEWRVELIGGAYVHGMMMGEAVDSMVWGEEDIHFV